MIFKLRPGVWGRENLRESLYIAGTAWSKALRKNWKRLIFKLDDNRAKSPRATSRKRNRKMESPELASGIRLSHKFKFPMGQIVLDCLRPGAAGACVTIWGWLKAMTIHCKPRKALLSPRDSVGYRTLMTGSRWSSTLFFLTKKYGAYPESHSFIRSFIHQWSVESYPVQNTVARLQGQSSE